MALLEYICKKCGKSEYLFPEEEERVLEFSKSSCKKGDHVVEIMPPKVRCVHSTEIFMLSQLDSVFSVHELNSKVMQEARDEKEVKAQNEARREK